MSFKYIENVLVPSRVIDKTCKFFQKLGSEEKEAVSLWVGRSNDNTFYIKEVMLPKQISNNFFFYVSENELDRINRELYKKNLRMIAQIHTHRGIAFHSSIDDEYPIVTTLGGFSIVLPNYGFVSTNNFHEFVIFQLTEHGWIELTQKEISAIFSLVDER